MLHLKTFLEFSHAKTVEEALLRLRDWNTIEDNGTHEAFHSLLKSIVTQSNKNNALLNVLQYSKEANFKCWRFYLLVLKQLITNDATDDELNAMKAVAKGKDPFLSVTMRILFHWSPIFQATSK